MKSHAGTKAVPATGVATSRYDVVDRQHRSSHHSPPLYTNDQHCNDRLQDHSENTAQVKTMSKKSTSTGVLLLGEQEAENNTPSRETCSLKSVDSPTRSYSPPQQIGGSEDGYFPRDDRVNCHQITVVCQPWKNSFSHATHNPAGDNRFPRLRNRRRSICIWLSHEPGRPKYEAQAHFTEHPGRRQT